MGIYMLILFSLIKWLYFKVVIVNNCILKPKITTYAEYLISVQPLLVLFCDNVFLNIPINCIYLQQEKIIDTNITLMSLIYLNPLKSDLLQNSS